MIGRGIKVKKKIIGSVLAGVIALSFSVNADAATRYSNQDVSAYTADPVNGKITTSWGTTPKQYYSVAVHPNTYSTNKATAVKSGPVIPYGKTIITDQEISMQGYANGWDDTFRVEDLGDLAGTRKIRGLNRGFTRYWFDIYFGAGNGNPSTLNTNENNASKFGVKTGINYTVY